MLQTSEQLVHKLEQAEQSDEITKEEKAEYLHEICQTYINEEANEAAVEYANKAIESLSQVNENNELKAKIISTAAEAFSKQKEFDISRSLFLNLTESFAPESPEQAEAFYHTAYFFLSREKFSEAKNYFIHAADIYENTKKPAELADTIHALGNSYAMEKAYNEALFNYEKAIDIFEANELLNKAYKSFLNIRIMHKQASTPKSYLKYCKKKIKKYKKRPVLAYILQEIALIHETYANKKKEENYLEQAVAAKEAAGITAELGLAYGMLADFYDNRGDDQKAVSYNLKAAELMIDNTEYEQLGPVMNFLEHSTDEMDKIQETKYEELLEKVKKKNITIELE
jgi:tetratricopeptide (TPR) repeat protein